MPVKGKEAEARKKFAYPEAFGRLMPGIASWLELGGDNTEEGRLRQYYIELIHQCFSNAMDDVEIIHSNGETLIYVNQQRDGGKWILLGEWLLNNGNKKRCYN